MSKGSKGKSAGKSNLYSPEEILKDTVAAWDAFQKLSDDEKVKNPQWWSKIISVNWDDDPFLGGHSSRWWTITATFGGRRAYPAMRFIKEKAGNNIMPKQEKDAIEMRKRNPNSKFKIEARGINKGYIRIKKYLDGVQADEKDNFEYKKGADGKPILPDENRVSKTYMALWWYFKAVVAAINYQKSIKKIANDDTKDPSIKKYIHSEVLSVHSSVKEEIKVGPFKGKKRLNPFIQIGLNFGRDDPKKNTQWLDKSKKFIHDGQTDFHKAVIPKNDLAGEYEGQQITDDNVHLWYSVGQELDGSINIGSVCASSMGLSCSAKAKMIITQPKEKRAGGAADIYDGDGDDDIAHDSDDEDAVPKPDSVQGSTAGPAIKDDNKNAGASANAEKAKTIYQENMKLLGKKE